MKAIAVFPGKPDSIHLASLPAPSLDEIPNGRGVLVKVLRVGVDGTDKEINLGEYGAAPPGYDFLTIGHESFGRVAEVIADRLVRLPFYSSLAEPQQQRVIDAVRALKNVPSKCACTCCSG